MKFKLLLIAAFTALLALSGCGGGSSPAAPVYDAPAFVKTDTVVGTGAQAALGNTVNVTYTLWLYDSTKSDFKGASIQTGTHAFMLASGSVIDGWVQGVPGMKVGGKRTLIVPASLGYGNNPPSGIPANSGLVFDIELLGVN